MSDIGKDLPGGGTAGIEPEISSNQPEMIGTESAENVSDNQTARGQVEVACSIPLTNPKPNLSCDLIDAIKSNQELFRTIRQDLVGATTTTTTPFGEKTIVYADWTASGRALGHIEDVIKNEVLQSYANTHTETSYTGAQTTKYRDQARRAVLASVGGVHELDCVLFAGNGSSAAIEKLQRVMGLSSSSPIQNNKLAKNAIVFVSIAEHHSNLLSWKQGGCQIELVPIADNGLLCTKTLTTLLRKYASKKLKIGSFSAASNITGIKFQVKEITSLLHAHGALAFWDFAAAGPYIDINVTNKSNQELNLDAIFISPHKFVGAAGGTPGVLVAKRKLFSNDIPTFAGGGTVKWVYSLEKYKFDPTIENREEGGTPAIVSTIRCGLVFRLKDKVGPIAIHARELKMIDMVKAQLGDHPNILILGGLDAKRLAIFSFLIKPTGGGSAQWLHYNFACTLLNDLFGIQARGGCSCAGPYGAYLLGIPNSFTPDDVPEYLKPGWIRISLNYFISDVEAEYIIAATKLIAEKGHHFLPYYKFNEETGKWSSTNRGSLHLKSLSDLDMFGTSRFYKDYNECRWRGGNNDASKTTEHHRQLAEDMRHARMLEQLQAAQLLVERMIAEVPPIPYKTCPKAYADQRRWFMLPGEIPNNCENDKITSKWEPGIEYLPSLMNTTQCEKSTLSHAICGDKAPFFTSPWYAAGNCILGKEDNVHYINENAVRARAGLLNATGWVSAFLILYLPQFGIKPFVIVKYLAGLALWEMFASSMMGLTPLAPYGVLATLITISQKPVWKPSIPKRFAWCLGIVLLGCCFVAGSLHERWFAFGLAISCIILTGMEAWFGFCMGCFVYNLVARALGRIECEECKVNQHEDGDFGSNASTHRISTATMTQVLDLKTLLSKHPNLIFTKATCNYCNHAKDHFKALCLQYHEVRLDHVAGFKYVPTLREMTSQTTVPYIFMNGKFIGGYSELMARDIAV